MVTTHYYPQGETFIAHMGGVDCACKPKIVNLLKAQTVSANGRHQGYRSNNRIVTHNKLK